MAKISRLIKKQKHYNYIVNFPDGPYGDQFNVVQIRETPYTWMIRTWSIRMGRLSRRSQWSPTWEATDPRGYYEASKTYTKVHLCNLKSRFRKLGIHYAP